MPDNEEDQIVPSESTDPPFKEVKLEIQIPDEFVYSNIAGVTISQTDIRVIFAEVLPNAKCLTKVGVVLTPEHAAALALSLSGNVREYEKQWGDVRLKQWQRAKAKVASLGIGQPEKT